jgi:recombinational DNA repair protein (RecF pathway)
MEHHIMAKPQPSKQEVVKCAKCHKTLTDFMAYIPGEGDVCLKCFSDYAQEEENLLVTRSTPQKKGKTNGDKN